MKLSDFDYRVPKNLIAQHPSKVRGEDRLLIVERAKNIFTEKRFDEISEFFKEGDLIVLNNTKVIPARMFGRRKTGGRVEIFVLSKTRPQAHPINSSPIMALVRPSGKMKDGETITLDSGDRAIIGAYADVGRFVYFERPLAEIMKSIGHVPLPPYISRADEPEDRERYQTVYARSEGATASPTAGLHFTGLHLSRLKEKGVEIAYVTLHVSYGTFAPIKEETVENHRMHSEYYEISPENAKMIARAHDEKRKIFACGTTSLRTLETCAGKLIHEKKTKTFKGQTDLFIYPGYTFKIVDSLITNFHLPKSTLLLLASAFCEKELLFRAYSYAVRERFRFFSYGDAMLIL